jgi:hypothetical protein
MTRITLATLALLASLTLPSLTRAQPTCDPPRVLFSFDRSSSMNGALDGSTKWEVARRALVETARALENRAQLGLQLFPFPDRCEPGEIVRELGSWPAAELLRDLAEPPADTGLYTPMAETLAVLETYAPLLAPEHAAHVVLLTDGWQWCDPHDPSRRFAAVDVIARLRGLGVRVHVVGFGDGVDAVALHRAAIASGALREGCDASHSEPGPDGGCHHRADDELELRAVLASIVTAVVDESCNGFDDDCDGAIDEGFDRDGDGHTSCGSVPGGTDPVLADCDDEDAWLGPSATELCNGRDDDCDGVIDPGCGCTDGESRRCGGSEGACTPGLQRCVGGAWSVCEGEVLPALAERCDGVDDDCDGTTDEGASCGEDGSCVEGACVPVAPMPAEVPLEEPPPPPQDAKMVGGCACDSSGSNAHRSFVALLGLVALVLGSRRRASPDRTKRGRRAKPTRMRTTA